MFCNDKTGYNSLLVTLTIGYYSLGWYFTRALQVEY